MGSDAVRGLLRSVRSVDRGRLIVYPAIGALALATALGRFGWLGAGSSRATPPVVELHGETDEQQPITVSLNGRGEVVGLATRLIGVCGSGGSYTVSWEPRSPAVRFRSVRGVVTAAESKASAWSRGISHTTARTTLRVENNVATGDARYEAAFEYHHGGRVRCDSGLIHWTARHLATPEDVGAGRSLSFGRWAGYSWRGAVTSVRASWTVPQILPGSSPGTAGTWIGAQALARPRSTRPSGQQAPDLSSSMQALLRIPFIQVGVNEDRAVAANGGTRDTYYAFWSDTAHQFRAIKLFDVHPGDEIVAGLKLTHRGWRVQILDGTSGSHAVLPTRDETGEGFDAAEWSQEHVTHEGADETIPYPQTSPVVIRQLKVNSTSPDPEQLYSRWMSENGRYLVPTPVLGDSFVLRERTLSRAGERYLRIVSGLNRATERFYAQIRNRPERGRQIERDREQLLSTYQITIGRLRGAAWPANVQQLIDILIEQSQTLITQTRLLPASGRDLHSWAYTWYTQTEAASATGQAIRRTLKLPPTGPN